MYADIAGAGGDAVYSTCPIPAGCTLSGVWMHNTIKTQNPIDTLFTVNYGISGFVVPVLDPDAATVPDTLWDTLVPKDVAVAAGAFDLDTGAIDATPEYEVGEMDLTGLFGFNASGVEEIFRRRHFMNIVTSRGLYFESGSPDTYLPSDEFKSRVTRKYLRDVPSMCLFGLSHPSLDRTVTDVTGAGHRSPAEHEWVWLSYIEMVLERAWAQLQGIIEAGAETPWEEAATFLEGFLEPPPTEGTAGHFDATQNMHIIGNTTYQLRVPGQFSLGSISSEGVK